MTFEEMKGIVDIGLALNGISVFTVEIHKARPGVLSFDLMYDGTFTKVRCEFVNKHITVHQFDEFITSVLLPEVVRSIKKYIFDLGVKLFQENPYGYGEDIRVLEVGTSTSGKVEDLLLSPGRKSGLIYNIRMVEDIDAEYVKKIVPVGSGYMCNEDIKEGDLLVLDIPGGTLQIEPDFGLSLNDTTPEEGIIDSTIKAAKKEEPDLPEELRTFTEPDDY